jgi:hypothetical protein
MKIISLAVLALLSSTSFAQDKPEKVEVTGSRIPGTVFGPIAANPSGPIGPTHGCADPTCGGAIDPKEPGGSGAVTQQEKNANNKKAREKAKKEKEKLAENMKQDRTMLEKILEWMAGVNMGADAEGAFSLEIETNAVKIKGQGCLKYHAELNKTNPTAAGGRCTERRVDPIPVQKSNGVYENQLELSYTIYDECYWTKKCGPQYITFIAGSQEELKSFVNEVVGEPML